jgi:hypothetical protein
VRGELDAKRCSLEPPSHTVAQNGYATTATLFLVEAKVKKLYVITSTSCGTEWL